MKRSEQDLILASKSAIRHQILQNAGVSHRIVDSNVDEQSVKAHLLARGIKPDAFAAQLAYAKADVVSQSSLDAFTIGADQTLIMNGDLFSKPKTPDEAKAMLLKMRGGWHHLHASVCLIKDGRILWQHTDIADLKMRMFSDDFLDDYLDHMKDAVCYSVGGYQIEGRGLQLFEHIEGDYFTILGLPLLPLLTALRDTGYLIK